MDIVTNEPQKKKQLIRVFPRYVRLRQGSENSYYIKLARPPTKGKGVTIHVCVIMNKCGITATPQQIVITSSDWKLPREIVVTSEIDSEVRTIQIHHKIHETYDDLYNANTIVPSVFASVLQKEATFLFSFGCGLHGRLGTSDERNANLPTPFASRWLHPVQIACGKAHSAIVDVYSHVYCFGLGVNGQLGQGDSNLDATKIPLRVHLLGTASVLHVACGSNHTMCLTTEGKVFAWGDNTFGQLGLGSAFTKPRGIPTRVEKVVNIRTVVCGGAHSFLVTLDNNVLACGNNIAGQLGLGDRKDRAVFERIQFFRMHCGYAALSSHQNTNSAVSLSSIATSIASGWKDTSVAIQHPSLGDLEICCGHYHSMALFGKRVYSWGNGDDGRLGHDNLETYLEPMLIGSLQNIPIKSIACGGSHSGALAENGDVYLWGNGQYGQLGNGVLRHRRTPTKVRILHGKRVVQLAFGEWHSMALCEDGTVFSWGFGEEGQLGLPDEKDLKSTRIVPLPSVVNALSGMGATMVRCGGSHSFVVSVLEARRSNLARLHRRSSRMEILKERQRIAVIYQRQASRRSKRPASSQDRAEDDDHNSKINQSDKSNEVSAATTVSVKKKTQKSPLMKSRTVEDSQRQSTPLSEERPLLMDYSWRQRPLSSRTSVRNALRQEVKVFAELKEVLAPLPSSSSQMQSQNGKFMSPRLKRLHDQVKRATDAGAVLTKGEGFVSVEGIPEAISMAVQTATRDFLGGVGSGLTVDVSTSRPRQTKEYVPLSEMLREVRGMHLGPSDEASSGEESDGTEIVVFRSVGSRTACETLEHEIRCNLSC